MSVLKTFFSKKSLSSIALLLLLIPLVYIAVPAPKAHAQWYVISTDPVSDFPSVHTMITNTITAMATPMSASNSTAQNIKSFVLNGIAWNMAKLVVKDITAQTVNWINTGFNGNPAFVANPAQFFTNQADMAVTSALNNIPGQNNLFNQMCSAFQVNVRLALATQYLQQARLGQCSIQGLVKGYSGFIQNFANGGWEAWMTVTQNQQNNPYGTFLAGQDTLNLGIASSIKKYQTQISTGKGFLSWESCSGTSPGSSIPQASIDACVAAGGSQKTCSGIGGPSAVPTNCTTQTPGSVIESQLETQLGAPIAQLNLVNSINEIVSALLQQGIKSIFGAAKGGLAGLSQSQNGQPALTTQQLSTSDQSKTEATSNLQTIGSNLPTSLYTAVLGTNTSTVGAGGTGAGGVDATTTAALGIDPTQAQIVPTVDEAAVAAQVASQQQGFQTQFDQSKLANTGGTIPTTQ